jgi:DNA-binding MarR family transcriptional regulator
VAPARRRGPLDPPTRQARLRSLSFLAADVAAVAADLKVFYSRLRRRMQDAAAGAGLSAPQASVLARLEKDGPSSASVLAGAERMRPQSMAAIVKALEEQGLIERAAHPDDGRRRVISLTASGRRLAQGARATRDEWLVRALRERYTDAERARIAEALELLDRLVQP